MCKAKEEAYRSEHWPKLSKLTNTNIGKNWSSRSLPVTVPPTGLQTITNYKPKATNVAADPLLPNQLNNFSSRFERTSPPCLQSTLILSTIHCSRPLHTTPLSALSTITPTPPSPPSPITITAQQVSFILRKQKIRKAAGPDGVSPATTRYGFEQLSSILADLFNQSLSKSVVPVCFKTFLVIIPVPKKQKISCLNDYRLVALTSVVMQWETFDFDLSISKSWLMPSRTLCSLHIELTGL